MEKLYVIKIGGNIIDDKDQLQTFLKDFSMIKAPKIVVHGGGKSATELSNKLKVEQHFVDGRRITTAETLDIAVMVYAGLINKNIVAGLQYLQCNAIGFTGADANLIRSKKRDLTEIDFGYVGDIPEAGINVKQFKHFISHAFIPVICPVTHNGEGGLLNTNADTMASKIASALSCFYNVELVFCFEKQGVLTDPERPESYMPSLNKQQYLKMRSRGVISKGMIPKLDNAFEAVEKGVKKVTVCHAKHISGIATHLKGTQIILT